MATKSKSRVEEIEDLISETIEQSSDGESVQELAIELAEMRRQGLSRPRFNLESPYSHTVHWCEPDSVEG